MASSAAAGDPLVIRLVYDGPPQSGKTTTLVALAGGLARPLVSPEEAEGRTLFFDWVEYVGGSFDGLPIRCQIVSVPGQRALLRRRQALLAGADVVVFVADSTARGLAETADCLASLRAEMAAREGPPVGLVLQANKRDQPDALPLDVLRGRLDLLNMPCVESVAIDGVGIRETFVLAVRLALDRVRELLATGRLPLVSELATNADELLAEVRSYEALAPALAAGDEATTQPAAVEMLREVMATEDVEGLRAVPRHGGGPVVAMRSAAASAAPAVAPGQAAQGSAAAARAPVGSSVGTAATAAQDDGGVATAPAQMQAGSSVATVASAEPARAQGGSSVATATSAAQGQAGGSVAAAAQPPGGASVSPEVVAEAGPPRLPDSTAPSGRVWPPIEGRALLHEASDPTVAAVRQADGSWLAEIGSWRFHSFAAHVYRDLEDGKQALVHWARLHAGGSLERLSPRRCLVLADTGRGSWRVWQLVALAESLRRRLAQRLLATDAAAAAAALMATARQLMQARRTLSAEPRLPCRLGAVADVERRVVYSGLLPQLSWVAPAGEYEADDAALLRRELEPLLQRCLPISRLDVAQTLDALQAERLPTAEGRRLRETVAALLIAG